MKNTRTSHIRLGMAFILGTAALSLPSIGAPTIPEGNFSGSYSTPVRPALAPQAAFANSYTVKRAQDGKLLLSYFLPEELVGSNPVQIQLKESGTTNGGLIDFTGPHDDAASCRLTDKNLVCLVLYPTLKTDLKDIEGVLRNKYPDLNQLGARLEVARLFGNDPKGIVNCVFHAE